MEYCMNPYQTCRIASGFTQEQATELLAVSIRTLSNYENDHAPVPEDVVKKMIEVYNSPSLAWQHFKHTSILGEYLTDVAPPQSYSDMVFQLILAQNDLEPAVHQIMEILRYGCVDSEQQEGYETALEQIKGVNAKLLSVLFYAQRRDPA